VLVVEGRKLRHNCGSCCRPSGLSYESPKADAVWLNPTLVATVALNRPFDSATLMP
jgi:hypothetical protein